VHIVVMVLLTVVSNVMMEQPTTTEHQEPVDLIAHSQDVVMESLTMVMTRSAMMAEPMDH
jgi:hypothetical protein